MKKIILVLVTLTMLSSCLNNTQVNPIAEEQENVYTPKEHYELKNFMTNIISEYPSLIAENVIERRGNNSVIDSIKSNIDSLVKYNEFEILKVLAKNSKNEYLISFQLNTNNGYANPYKINEVILNVMGLVILDDINELEYKKKYTLIPEGKLISISHVKGVYTKRWSDIFYVDCGIVSYSHLKIK